MPHAVAVDPYTGSASLQIPLPLPQGRAGFGPALALTYSSSAPNSPYGLGWSLAGVPSIAVSDRRRLPRYDGSDEYAAGGDELAPALVEGADTHVARVARRDGHVVRFFRSRTAGAAIRYEMWTDEASGRVHWRSRDARNVLTIYGAAPDDSSRIADPDDPRRVSAWLADRQVDPHGNLVVFEHAAESRDGVDSSLPFERARVGRPQAQRYLQRIRWGNAQDGRFCFELVVDHGDHAGEPPGPEPELAWPVRPDPFSYCRAGFEVRTYRLCRRFLVFHRFDELGQGATLIQAVELDHTDTTAGAVVSSVRITGYRRVGDQVVSRALPPLRLTYGEPAVGHAFEAAPDESFADAPLALAAARHHWVDLFGEGLPGLLTELDGAWYYKRNRGGGRLELAACLAEVPAARARAFSLGDFDADGDTDLASVSGRHAGLYELDRDREGWEPFAAFPSIPHVEALAGRAQWLDLDGDGRPDVVLAEPDRFVWFRSTEEGGFAEPISIPKPAGPDAAPQLHEDRRLDLYFADMNDVPETGEWGARFESQ